MQSGNISTSTDETKVVGSGTDYLISISKTIVKNPHLIGPNGTAKVEEDIVNDNYPGWVGGQLIGGHAHPEGGFGGGNHVDDELTYEDLKAAKGDWRKLHTGF